MRGVRHDDASGVDLLMSPVRRAIIDVVAGHRPAPDGPRGMTARQLSVELELHVSTVRFHVDQLVAAGCLETEVTAAFGVGRPRKLYSLTPGWLIGQRDPEAFTMLASLLVDSFQAGLTPSEAGHRWAEANVARTDELPASTPGEWLGKVGRMVDVLQEWGYTPELTTSNGGRTAQVDVRHCPFRDLAESSPSVVCGIHRGLIDGALQQLAEPDTVVSLHPFVSPGRCEAIITTRMPFRSRTRETA